jgi:energy-coupling factor transport system substrate-specific component
MIIAALALVAPAFDLPLPGLLLNWGLISAVLVILVCVAFFMEFEAATMNSKEIALVAMLGTISAILRVPFAAIPSVQPCTYLIICTGFVFGPVAGFMVGAITAIISNLFLAQGPWTLYQMIAWGLAGVSAGYLGRLNVNRVLLIVLGVLWGYLFGWITNIWYWTALVYPLTVNTFIVTQLSTVWFDTLHAAGNAFFLGVLGMRTIAILQRFKRRFSVEYSAP